MEENKGLLLKSTMSYGLIMGIFWVIKYLFFIFGYSTPSLIFIYWCLSFAVPFIAYYMTKRYKYEIGGHISFFHAWRFGTMLYFFAALIVSLEQFIFLQFIAPDDFLTNMAHQMITILQDSQANSEVVDAISQINFTPIHMVIQQIFNNIFYGILLSVPVAAIVCRKDVAGAVSEQE
ncbi:DUF4199 domain-containing protein [Parabacteroides sp. AM08-6]|uniref:DUF4199 domain-containing protein n=1 Tax=Parabacteroides sp. AM08-6 TaxID=2292053 RepID=UPI000F002604|nr:DUF4199 domain-containing protein [Parabacteroides sp. AM08-6]RHJ83030.1 DUF4199 domain-containing protein [Parabacteroides sp. AM08-6]